MNDLRQRGECMPLVFMSLEPPWMPASPNSPARWMARLSLLLAFAMSACASNRLDVIESSSTTMNRQADVYEQQARDLQMVGAGRAGVELQRLGDKQRLDAKRMEANGVLEGAFDLLFNSLFQSWLNTSPKGLQK